MSNMRYFMGIVAESAPVPRPIEFEQYETPSPKPVSDKEVLRCNPEVVAEVEEAFATGRKVNITNMTKDEFMARYRKKDK